MRYFITGATGFIGGEVTRQLREAGHEVIALVRSPQKADKLKALGVEIAPGDITDKASMRGPMTGVDGIFHMAAWYEVGAQDSSMAERINVQGTRNVLELMQELAIPKGVYTSTVAVFGDTGGRLVDESFRHNGPWISEYDRTKWLAHYGVADPLIQNGLPLVIVQPGVVYGADDTSSMGDAVRDYLRKKLPVAPKKAAFCWATVQDTAHGHLLAMDKGTPGQSYIIAGPVHTFEEVLDYAASITGIPAPALRPGPGLMRLMAASMQPVSKILPLPASYHPESLRVMAGATYTASNAKARRELGWVPEPLSDGLPPVLAYEMEKLGIKSERMTFCVRKDVVK